MASIDKRIVEMKFDNAAFERGVSSTLSTLDRLKQKLNFSGAAKGLDELGRAGKNVNLSGMGAGVDSLTAKFSALQVAGLAALGTIVARATSAGTQLVKSLTLDPILQGFSEYELKMGSIQTILANTQRHGTELSTVNRELDLLNEYADKTIYNFAEMTKNASLFTNSGMKIEDATTVIKGFSNAAAASGTSAEGAAGAAYQLSQALNTGTIRLMDWKSLQNVGMGGKNMQEGIIQVAQAMGTFNENTTTAEAASANFNGSLETMWLSADVMSTYLKIMSNDMTEAEMAALGLDAAAVQALKAQANTALEAATKVRTLTGLMGTLKEAVASGWTESFEMIFGNFTEATELFTGINDVIGGMLAKSAEGRNKMLADWKEMGGREALIRSVQNAFTGLMGVLKPIRDAFRDVFPAMTGERLFKLTRSLESLTAKMRVGGETAENLKSTFSGIFSVFKIVLDVVGGVVKTFLSLFMTVGEGAGGFLALTGLIGDFVTNIQKFLSYTGLIDKFFAVLLSPLILLKPLIALVSDLVTAFADLASGDISSFTAQFKEAFGSLGQSLGEVREKITGLIGNLGGSFEMLGQYFSVMAGRASASGNAVVAVFAGAFAAISGFISRFVTDARGTIADLVETFRSAAEGGQNFFAALGGAGLSGLMSLIDNLSERFNSLKSNMDFSGVFSQFNSGATTVSTGGVAVLSGSFNVISTILGGIKSLFSGISGSLGPFLSELGAFFTTLVKKIREYISSLDMQDAVALLNTGFFIAMYIALRRFLSSLKDIADNFGRMIDSITGIFDQLTSTLKTMQTNIRANIILKIAIAVGILVAAVYALSKIDANALKQGLIALAAIFVQIGIMLAVLTRYNPASFTSAAFGMIAMATAIRILASAIGALGEMDPKVLLQGGIALGVIMAALAGMSMILNGVKGLFVAAAGLLILAAAMTAMAAAIALYAAIPFDVLEKGILAMGAALLVLGVAMQAFPKGMVLKAAGITILAGAMVILTGALAVLGNLSLDTLAKGIIAMAAALAILVVAAYAMTGSLAGAAAMLVMAGALAILVPALALLGALPMETIIKGMFGLAAILGIFVVAMYALTPVIVTLALFAGALKVLGLAMLLAGTGFALFVAALGALTVVGAAGFGVLIVGIEALLNMLPLMAQQLGHAVIAFAKVLGDAAPKVAEMAGKIIMAFINEVAKRIPQIADAGLRMIIGILEAIRRRIGDITNLAIDIVVIFITTLKGRLPTIIQAGLDFILSFMEGLAKAVNGEKERTGEAGSDLAMALIEGLIEGLKSLGQQLGPKIVEIAKGMVDSFKKFFGINSPSTLFNGFGIDIVMGLIGGLGKMFPNLGSKVKELGRSAITSIRGMLPDWANAGIDFVVNLVTGLARSGSRIATQARESVRAAINAAKTMDAGEIGRAMISGLVRAISNGMSLVTNAAKNLAKGALDAAKNFLGIKSPSKEFQKIGEFVNEGFAKGMLGSQDTVTATFSQMTELLKNAMDQAASTAEDAAEKQRSLTESIEEQNREIDRQVESIVLARQEAEKNAAATDATAESNAKANREIEDAERKLTKMTKARDADIQALEAARQAEINATKERGLAAAGHQILTNRMQKEKTELQNLAGAYETLTGRVEEANQVLNAAVQTRDDYNKSIAEKYGALPDVARDVSVAKYISNLEKKLKETNAFSVAIQKLRALGLSDEMYKELLAKGVDVFPFVKELLAGGSTAVRRINQLGTGLDKAAASLGKTASRNLYQAGVDAAQGIVNGLESQMSSIQKAMEKIADLIETKLRIELELQKPKPPKVWPSQPRPWMRGGSNRGQEISDAPGDGIEVPVHYKIMPVVDLTHTQKRFQDAIAAKESKRVAALAAASHLTSRQISDREASAPQKSITFNQYNSSPKALSSAEIYRQTNNQISVAKGALTNA